jgi:hypothetical protein
MHTGSGREAMMGRSDAAGASGEGLVKKVTVTVTYAM